MIGKVMRHSRYSVEQLQKGCAEMLPVGIDVGGA